MSTKSGIYEIDEARLIIALKKSDIFAFNEIYRRYSQKVYNFTVKHISSTADIEDTVQEVFITIWNHRTFLDENQSFNGYIFTITLNLIRKFYRNKLKNRKLIEKALFSERSYSDITNNTINFKSINGLVQQHINQLPPKRKKVYVLSRINGLSNDEIAEKMNISKKTVENHLNLALKELRKYLTQETFISLAFLTFFH